MSKGVIHHVEIYVSDLKKTIEFWSWFLEELGYDVFQKWDSGISWRLGETYIVFVQTEERFLDVPYHRSRVGLNHLAFHATSREQVDDVTHQLNAKGVTIRSSDMHPDAGGERLLCRFHRLILSIKG